MGDAHMAIQAILVSQALHKMGRSLSRKFGASLLQGVDATKLKQHHHLNCRRFDRVVFNFPHAGFHGKESDSYLIRKHRGLVFGFFQGASHMLRANGEIHVPHRNKAPFSQWNLEELASKCSLVLIQRVAFEKTNYPGYENKRGDGSRCNRTFILGDCSTFRFHVSTELHTDNMKWKQVKGGESKREQFVECTNRVCRVSSEIHIGELGRLSPRERTRFPYSVQQRIVLKIDMSENEKAIKKAMKLASGASGVRSVGIQGQNDQLVVVGAGIDTAELTRLLRKKVCPTTSIVTVQAAPPPRPQQQQQQPQFHLMEHHNEMAPARRCICEIPNSGFCGFCRLPPYQMVALPYPAPVVYREESDGCRIM
ncbi:heavy metal-associated isoprenylated plant protein 41-like [Brassica napus]|uniref:heavy metal-associated isoprenylated plant protein 41-like n=1 Tax=Brassica napus TaxID=3708 RepID=UPI00207859B7|nr:heavy metal-associated isoprenylated plant protein 41-like [Brassica napus]